MIGMCARVRVILAENRGRVGREVRPILVVRFLFGCGKVVWKCGKIIIKNY